MLILFSRNRLLLDRERERDLELRVPCSVGEEDPQESCGKSDNERKRSDFASSGNVIVWLKGGFAMKLSTGRL